MYCTGGRAGAGQAGAVGICMMGREGLQKQSVKYEIRSYMFFFFLFSFFFYGVLLSLDLFDEFH